MDQQIHEAVLVLLARQVGVGSDALNGEMRLQEDLGLDSTDAAELLVTLRQTFGVQIELESLEGLATIQSVMGVVSSAVADREAQ